MDEVAERVGGVLVLVRWRGIAEMREAIVANGMEAVDPDNALAVT